MTTQLPRYNSPYSDPQSEAIDAMSQAWVQENNYINPPFWMIGRVLKKLEKDKATAALIAPIWRAQP